MLITGRPADVKAKRRIDAPCRQVLESFLFQPLLNELNAPI